MGYEPHIFILCQGHGQPAELLEDGFGTMFRLECVQGFPYVEPLTADMDPSFYLSDDYIFSRFFDYKKVMNK
jgi:hypothetical protein